MRSSIACSRCRRSKIKCVNSGIDTTCRACESSGRECVYPTPAIGAGGASAKRDLGAIGDGDGDRPPGEWDGPKRSRPRKTVGASASSSNLKDAAKGAADALDAPILTLKVWESLFDLFQSHFSTILPFLHPTTFLNQIRLLSSHAQPDGQTTAEQSQSPAPKVEASPLILLGVLALTARFHPQLANYHSPSSSSNPSNPLVASEFYATALRNRLAASDGLNLVAPDLSRVQALLMLGLHEWEMCRGKSAWVYVGIAIRISQSMGLAFEPASDGPSSIPSPYGPDAEQHYGLQRQREQKGNTSDDVIDQETKRRVFWACFMMDRCLSGGKYRPRMVYLRDMGIQLPSDTAFAFGERVRTSQLEDGSSRRSQGFDPHGMQMPHLRQSISYDDPKLRPGHRESLDNGFDRWEVGAEECVLSRLIRIVRIWGSVAKWTCSGGRRCVNLIRGVYNVGETHNPRDDSYPPWHPESRFYQLKSQLSEFTEGLSRNLQFCQRNTDTHIMYKNTLAPYTLMHAVYFLSVIVLHKAYIPFLPLRCNGPEGPRDEPSFSPDKYKVPEDFWRENAREIFRAARQMMDLIKTCQERDVLVESPLMGFAIYNAALVGVYAGHFNYMDLDGYMCTKPNSTDIIPGAGGQGQIEARRAIEIVGEMRPRLKMAVGWFRTIHRVHSYYTRVKRDMRRRSSRRQDSIHENDVRVNGNGRPAREGGLGFPGSPDEFKLLEKALLDLGSAEDHVGEGVDEDGGPPTATATEGQTGASDNGSNAVKSEPGDGVESDPARRESWVPINSPVHGITSGAEGDNPNAVPRTSRPPSDLDRRPSLPIPPTTRPLQSQSPYSLPTLPSIQHHPQTPAQPPATTTSPNIPPSLTSPNSYTSTSSSAQQPSHYAQNQANRLQPLQPFTSRPAPPPYTQSLPSINAATQQHGFPIPPLPASASAPFQMPSLLQNDAVPTALSSSSLLHGDDGISVSMGGDDVLAFVEGSSYEQWGGNTGGWLSAVWSDITH
ncbi:hypothetical protein FQN54_006105 [Arachnomyces sp. PD_36]|nr:hypothetical protein FQN54_006105 [Arachnomyces sp. PD_36]